MKLIDSPAGYHGKTYFSLQSNWLEMGFGLAKLMLRLLMKGKSESKQIQGSGTSVKIESF